ncbi:MAG TPA: transcription antitermination factor NusB, partial [Gammaproteobacteria bacterium]
MKELLHSERLAAARVLQRVVYEGESLSKSLPAVQQQLADIRLRAYVQAISYGTLRFHHRLSAVLDLLVDRPLKQRDLDIRCLLLAGLFELCENRTPGYAAVSEWVECAESAGKGWAKGLVNGVLRNFMRRREQLLERAMADPVARYASPSWLIDTVRHDWPESWEGLLQAGLKQAPMTLRVNLLQTTRDDYLRQLAAENIAAEPLEVESAIRLSEPVDVNQLPGFNAGLVSVQDAAA